MESGRSTGSPCASSITRSSSPPSLEAARHLLQAHRERARPLVQELVGAVDGRVEHAVASRARRVHGLEADRPLRVAELRRRGDERDRPPTAAIRELAPRSRRGGGSTRPCRSRPGWSPTEDTSTGTGKSRRAPARPSRSCEDWGRTTSTPSRSTSSSTASANPGSAPPARWRTRRRGSGRRPLAHVAADEPNLPLAVSAQRSEQRAQSRAHRRR